MQLIITINLLFFLTDIMFGQNPNSRTPVTYLALGDSYTIGESVSEQERWPNQLADSLRKNGMDVAKPVIIAKTGWRTDDLKNAMTMAHLKNEYSRVSLLIGVNNQYQNKPVDQYTIEFEDLLKTAIRLAQDKKENVFVVSIPDYGFTPFGRPKQSAISVAIDEFNAVNKRIAEKLGVRYVEITDISRLGLKQPDLVAPDGLHPSGKMYALWVERILKVIKLLFSDFFPADSAD